MVSSSKGARGVLISGVDTELEEQTQLDKNIVDGDYLDVERRNPVLISSDLAEDECGNFVQNWS
ncbi:MAG: hypothetical protein R2769_17115 [Saprospiraceae bacterium]